MPEAAPFESLLAQSRALVSEHLSQALAAMLDKAEEALSALATTTQERQAQKAYLEAKDRALSERDALEQAFRARYLVEFEQRCDRIRKLNQQFSDDDASLQLELVGEDDLNETLRFNEIAARVRQYCEEELIALDQRTGVLLGDANLQADANPFSPKAICDAYKHACRQVEPDVAVRGAFLKLFDDHVLDEVRSLYKAVNAMLVKNGILPKIRYSVRPQGAGKSSSPQAPAAEGAAREQDFFALLQNMLAAKGGAGTGATGGAVLQGAELLGSLTQLQLGDLSALGGAVLPTQAAGGEGGAVNVLRELKATSVGTSMGQMDAMTLDIVTMLFDQLFDDPKIPLGAKALIGRMQIPMLKVAIADKAFFSTKDHPARQLLDALGEISARLPADFNTTSPLYWRMEAIVQELIEGYKTDVGIFDTVRQRCITLMAEEDARVEEEAHARAEQIVREEALAVAKSVAQEEVRQRVQAHPLPGPVLEFLVEHWLKLLLIIHVKRGPENDAWRIALQAMDQLIWSVQPKSSIEERRQLASAVPALLKRLSGGLQALGAADGIRVQFFAELMKYHTELLAGNGKGKPAAEPRASRKAPDFNASITVRNPFGAGEVKVNAVDFSDSGGFPSILKVGTWAELRDGDKRQPARLIFISPRRTRCCFVDRTGKNYIEFTRAEILRRLRSGEVTVMDEVPEIPLFERIMRSVVGKMRGAPAH